MHISRALWFSWFLFPSKKHEHDMKQNQHWRAIIVTICLYSVFPHGAIAQTVPAQDDELQQLVRAASSSEREVWWGAVQRLGALASSDPVMRDAIWRRTHVNTLGIKFVRVKPGTFTMGPDMHRIFDPQVAHRVRLTQPFYIAVTEVTNDQFSELFPSHQPHATYSPDPDSPAVHITWTKASKFCKQLSNREDVTYRLPTEAEWEYACRAGATTLFSFGDSPRQMERFGWCLTERSRAAPVAQLQPNAWGIYDMHGNVFEWVADWFSHDYYASCATQGVVEDPVGPESGQARALRGGAWDVNMNVLACTCTTRLPLPTFNKKPFVPGPGIREMIGFRIVREIPDVESPRP